MLCSKGYPESYKNNLEIENINKINLNQDDFLFHAGTSKKKDKIFAVGGRVLNFVSLSNDFLTARNRIVDNLKKLNWTKGFYRSDIGHKVIKK